MADLLRIAAQSAQGLPLEEIGASHGLDQATLALVMGSDLFKALEREALNRLAMGHG